MKRKINMVGTGTLTVSLPSKWVKDNNLKKGDEVDLQEKGPSLILGAKPGAEKKEININLNSSDYTFIRALMRNLYIHGFELIRINYNSDIDYASISKAISDLDGFEITHESRSECTIETISDIRYEQFKTFYGKQFQIIRFMQELLNKAFKDGANESDKSIINSLNDKASKYACICRRSLTKNKLMNNDDAIVIFYVINIIHMIARNYNDCYEHIHKKNLKVSNDTKSFMKETTNLFDELYELNSKTKKLALTITEKREELLKNKLPLLLSKTSKDGMVLHYLGEIVRLIGTIAPKIELMNDFLENVSINF